MGAWYLLTVRFLKTNSGKKGEGMPVVRNPQFYFRERFQKTRRHEAIGISGVKPSGSFTRSAACVYLHAVKRILADARAVTQLTAEGGA